MLTADILPNAVRQQTMKMIYYHWLIVFFPSWDWRNVLPKFIELCMRTPCLCPSTYIDSILGAETNRNLCHYVLLRKRVQLILLLGPLR